MLYKNNSGSPGRVICSMLFHFTRAAQIHGYPQLYPTYRLSKYRGDRCYILKLKLKYFCNRKSKDSER